MLEKPTTLEEARKNRYGCWAGNPKGHAYVEGRCVEEIYPSTFTHHQCNRKNGYGPGGLYCKQHDPAAVAARRAESDARYEAQWQEHRYQIHGKTFFDALKKIAEGHNDARGLARDIIDKFVKDGKR